MKDNELDDLLEQDDELEDDDFATSINDDLPISSSDLGSNLSEDILNDDNDLLEDDININELKMPNAKISDNNESELFDDNDDFDDYDSDIDEDELLGLGKFIVETTLDIDDDFKDDTDDDDIAVSYDRGKIRKVKNMLEEDSKHSLQDAVDSIVKETMGTIRKISESLLSLNPDNKTTDKNLSSVNKIITGDIPDMSNRILVDLQNAYTSCINYYFTNFVDFNDVEKERNCIRNTLWFITTPLKEIEFLFDREDNIEKDAYHQKEALNLRIYYAKLRESIKLESTLIGIKDIRDYSLCDNLNCLYEASKISKYLNTILNEELAKHDKKFEHIRKTNHKTQAYVNLYIPKRLQEREDKDNCSIIDSIIVYPDKTTKCKCKCGHLFKLDYPLISACCLATSGESKISLLELPMYAECPMCKKKNILSINAREVIMLRLNKLFENEKLTLDDIRKDKNNKEKLDNIVRFSPSTDLLLEYAPAYFITEAEMLERYNKEDGENISIEDLSFDKKKDTKTEGSFIGSEVQFLKIIKKPLNKYRDWVNYYRDSSDTNVNAQGVDDFGIMIEETFLNDYPSLYSTRYDVKGLTNKLYSKNGKYVIKKFSKLICGILGRNYIDYKKDAVNTMVEFLNSTPIIHSINLERLWINEATYKSAESIKHMKELEPIDKFRSAQTLYRIIGPKNLYLGTEDKPDNENLDKYIDIVYDKVVSTKNDYDDMLIKRKKYINDLRNNTRIYAMIPIVRNTEVPKKNLDYLGLDNELKEFIDVVTDLEILNTNIDGLSKYMDICANRKGKEGNKVSLTSILKSVGDISRTDIKKKHLELLFNLGLLNSDKPGSFKGVPEKLSIILDLFTVTHFPPDIVGYDRIGGSPINNLLTLVELQEALKSKNEFDIMNCIDKLAWINIQERYYSNDAGTKVLDDYIYDTPTYHTIFNAINNVREIAHEFVLKYGNTHKDNLKYNLKGIFTEKEIDEEYTDVMCSVKFDRLLNRLGKESLSDYLDRLSKVDKEEQIEVFLRDDYKDIIEDNLVALEVCNIPMETAQETNNAYKYFTFSELFILAIQTNLEIISKIFMINPSLIGKLSTTEDYNYPSEDTKEARFKTIVEYSLYVNAEYNIGSYFTDLPQVEGADLDDTTDEEISISTKIDFYKVDKDSLNAFLKSAQYLDKGVYKEIYDYINGREEG